MGAKHRNRADRIVRTKALIAYAMSSGMSIQDVRNATGRHPKTVSDWRDGESPIQRPSYRALAEALFKRGMKIPHEETYWIGDDFRLPVTGAAADAVIAKTVKTVEQKSLPIMPPDDDAVEIIIELAVELAAHQRKAIVKRLMVTL